jgi:hypothetical protein
MMRSWRRTFCVAGSALALVLFVAPSNSIAIALAPADARVPPPGDFETRQGDVAAKPVSFEGTILVAGAEDVNRESTASGGCLGCHWDLIVACPTNGSGNSADTLCSGASAACSGAGILYRVYLTRPGSLRRQVGAACLGGPGSVITQVDINGEVAKAIDRMPLVAAQPTVGQSAPALANLATYFIANGKSVEELRVPLAGYEMVVTAKPRYNWNFGDGRSLDTTTQGRPYKLGDHTRTPPASPGAIAHWYSAPRAVNVTLTTTWHASYTLFSTDVIDVPAEVTPAAQTLPLTIREGRATLYN